MTTIRFEREGAVGYIVLAAAPFNRVDRDFPVNLAAAIRAASESDIRVLVVRPEGPNFSLGGDVRQWPGKDINWFRTFVAEVHAAYRAIEALRIPTIASVRGIAMGGGFELVLACDFVVASEQAQFQCVEVIAGQLPLAGGIQRLADAIGRTRAVKLAMLGEPISGTAGAEMGFVTMAVPDDQLEQATTELAERLGSGPTLAYAAIRALMKIWSSGGTPAADAAMMDLTTELFRSQDTTNAFAQVAEALEAGEEIPPKPLFVGS
ncbi:enoyl-CoA hydratase/carnithine racemase [Sphingobium xenophagum]|uniref:Enoyl-CoA hydratase/carnithine racemase n=1 Tax=Sphingobium xenophagum TaxID=121428 RepID=A0ABU1X6Q1_SPHXE|nr:enoyl-CoA hydratase/isomerase family protein [Sphingobium xenophagum]MDR7156817.1 enoyl-CoA hydratase/carnithine racemase [Sphingobium xenophagum]